MAPKRIKRGKATPKPKPMRRVRASPTLDTAALDYARLLADPCGGKIVPPIYPGGDAGFLFRAESFFTVATGATANTGIVHWSPGYVNNNATEIVGFENTGGSVVSAPVVINASPGRTFLISNARGMRCVAACLKMTYAGSESTRSGRLHYGITNAGLIDLSSGTSADAVAQTLQHYTRTPNEVVELFWKPNIADAEMCDPTEAANAQVRDRHAALTVAFTGLPVATGITFHFTAIYEWMPAPGGGIGSNANGKANSRNTLDDVLDYLRSRGFTFVHQAGQAVGQALHVGAMGAVYGLMSSTRNTRSLGFN